MYTFIYVFSFSATNHKKRRYIWGCNVLKDAVEEDAFVRLSYIFMASTINHEFGKSMIIFTTGF